jgi:hypothetical protein
MAPFPRTWRVTSLRRSARAIWFRMAQTPCIQGELFGEHLPTSTSVEVKRLATDPRLRLEINSVVAR